MGTNYYLRLESCDHCGRSDDQLHIGKSSAGWAFMLHVEDGPDHPSSLPEWLTLLCNLAHSIVDECGKVITCETMLGWMFLRSGSQNTKDADPKSMGELSRYDPGVNLWRHGHRAEPIPGCTVDLCRGDFS